MKEISEVDKGGCSVGLLSVCKSYITYKCTICYRCVINKREKSVSNYNIKQSHITMLHQILTNFIAHKCVLEEQIIRSIYFEV